MKRSALALTVITVLLCSAMVGETPVNLAKANPIPDYLTVDSPLEGAIYKSTEVPLRFSLVPMPEINYTSWMEDPRTNIYGTNFTSFSYSLDGNEFVETNGSTTLSGLSSGCHTLKIYGIIPFTNGTIWSNSSVNPTIHFDVFYHSPPTGTFATALVFAGSTATVVAVGIGLLVYFKKRKR